MIEIRNGIIILEDSTLTDYSILIKDDLIYDIAPTNEVDGNSVKEVIDAQNSYICPGFIDIHSDYIEHVAAPRVTSIIDFNIALQEMERELISHGITTMFHSISLLKNYGKKILRKAENVQNMAELIANSHFNPHMVRNRFHLRFELDNIEAYESVIDYVKSGNVDLLSFMDHTPGQGQYRNIEIYKLSYLEDEGYTREQIDEIIEKRMNSPILTYERIKKIADIACERGIPIASHDDDSKEKVDIVSTLHTGISEFPISIEAARAAKEKGMYTVMGAPNIVLGKSHNGNLSAREAVENDVVDILCSDYYPSSLLHAVFSLYDLGYDLCKLIKYVTVNPAKATKIDDVTGTIAKGKKADILLIKRLPNNLPFITHVFVDGILICKMNNRIS